MKITKSQLERIIKEELEEELVERDSMRTQVDTGPTQAIEDDDPTQVEPDTDNDKKYGLTQIIDDENPFDPEATVGVEASQELDAAPTQVEAATRVDPNTLGARVAAQQQYRRNRRYGYDIKRTPWATRKRTQVSPNRDQQRREYVGGTMNKHGIKEESITKNELLKMIREELAKLK